MASLRLFEVINQNYDLGGQLQTIRNVRNFTWTLQIMLASMASEAFRGQKKKKKSSGIIVIIVLSFCVF